MRRDIPAYLADDVGAGYRNAFFPSDAMAAVQACELPADALLRKYLHGGAYADCYFVDVAGAISHVEYVEAFYTTAVIKVERRLLGWFVAKPSTDRDARDLARGELDCFAAWTVEARSPDQLLLTDFQGRTRSWLMRAPAATTASACTRLYFGSAVVPTTRARSGQAGMGVAFRALLRFHKLYSRVLLRAAVSRLERGLSNAR